MTAVQKASHNELLARIKAQPAPVIIVGAGVVGEALAHACRDAGIAVACCCDNNIHKASSSLGGIRVIPTGRLRDEYADALFLISAADIHDVVRQLRDLGYAQWHAGGALLRDFDVFQHAFSAPAEFVDYAVATCVLCHENYLHPGKLFLRSVDVVITERCSLKCRDCSNLMQYYAKPADCDREEVLKSVDALCGIVDEINEFRVIGGEPFMNKEVHLITRRLAAEAKVKKIVIYTNGTIVPKADQLADLRDKKVLLLVTDYGELSRKKEELIRVLEQNGIAFYAPQARGWTDCAKIGSHHRMAEQQRELFRSCCAKNTTTLSQDRLYRCPFAANADRLGAVPHADDDSIALLAEPAESIDRQAMKAQVKAFLLEKEFLRVCDFCNGRPFGAPEITPAVQTRVPLTYRQAR